MQRELEINTSTDQDERDDPKLREVLVDFPDSLSDVAQIEAKRLGLSLEQWVTTVVVTALTCLPDEHVIESA